MSPQTQFRTRARRGFALVIALSLMVLLIVIAVGLLSLSAISLRSGGHESALAIARANARMALVLAIGDLQKQAGPDQRVTAGADLVGATENPAWTGIWRADQEDSKPVWLVSGERPDPSQPLPEESSTLLHSRGSDGADSQDLRAPAIRVGGIGLPGSIAWWVGDEGVKARVDLARPVGSAPSTRARQSRAQSALEPALTALGDGFRNLGPESEFDKTSLISMETLDFSGAEPEVPRNYFDDLTSGGEGLPVNVAEGRLKTDLSIIFDRSQQSKRFSEAYLGAKADNGLPSQSYTVGDPGKFYLSDSIRGRLPGGTGPNWGILWDYARLWKNISNQRIPVITSSPLVDSEIRRYNWPPYKAGGSGAAYSNDRQHTNSPVNPVVSQVQIGFRLKTRLIGPDRYRLQMQVKPVIGIWNPYNIPIQSKKYIFDCGFYPWLRYGSGISSGGQVPLPADTDPTGSTAAVVEVWLRDQWKLVEDPAVQGKTRLTMETEPVDLQAGEFRLFSVSAAQGMVARNKLKPAWNEEGAYEIDLIKANGSPAVLTGTLPDGSPRYLWIGDMFLDDLQKETTRARFPGVLNKTSTHGWFTLKAGKSATDNVGESLVRYTDLWNTGTGNPHTVPERILSGAVSATVTKKAKYKVTDLARNGGYEHLATWSFFLRTTTQIEDVNGEQRLRGWVDSNPRALSVSPHWEGAVAGDGKRQGWNFTSALIGGAHGTGLPAQIVGDGGFGNRGLVAEAREGSENIEPQIGAIGRYQGLGGASNTAVGGQPNVMIHDIPRSPLISVGQFQHAALSRYSFEPSFVVGNSYADAKIPLDRTVAPDFNGFAEHDVVDISHEINRRLWDDFYFSSLGLDYQAESGNSFDTLYQYDRRSFPLANPRMIFVPRSSDDTLDQLLGGASDKLPEEVSSRVRIQGAFNIHSTSKTAWKAVLSSMAASELPRIDPSNPGAPPVWESPEGTRFNRFGHVASANGHAKGDDGLDPAFWLGWRELDAGELDELAGEIVKEIKERGPFRSLAEFVNRNPDAGNIEHRRKGPLQAAIDRSINASLPAGVSDKPALKPEGPFSDAADGESQAVGHAGYLMQGDLLQSLGPILQARSDYFRIRASGQAFAPDGERVLATAWCEAFVQRVPTFVDSVDSPETRLADLVSGANKQFGRRFQMVSFRWLTRSEIQAPSDS